MHARCVLLLTSQQYALPHEVACPSPVCTCPGEELQNSEVQNWVGFLPLDPSPFSPAVTAAFAWVTSLLFSAIGFALIPQWEEKKGEKGGIT